VLHEFGRDWGDIQVDLEQADGRAFVDAYLDTAPNILGPAFRATLYQHTGGTPLFTIELLRGLQERGDLVRDEEGRWVEGPTLHWQRLPARVEAVIGERFSRLSADCQRLLQVASVEGEEFTAELLARVTNRSLPEVIRCLSETLSKQHRLVRAARLLRREPGGQLLSRYRFAHILFQRYLYDQLDEVARAHLHHSVAETLETISQREVPEVEAGVQDPTAPVRLAWHFEAAGQFDRAAAYLLQAGRRAVQLSAHEEAVDLFRRGLTLLERLPDTPERAQLEMQILMGLIGTLLPIQGWGSAERAQLAKRALELEQQHPSSEADLIGAIYLHAEMLSARGQHAQAMDLAELLLKLAQRGEEPAYIALGYYMLGWNHFFAGDMVGSIADFRQALALYDRQRHARLLPWTDEELGVGCLSLLAMAFCYAGYADQGLACSQQALAQAEELANPLTQAVALAFAGCGFHTLLGLIQPVAEYARRLIELSAQRRLPMFRSYGLIFEGWALAMGGAGERAIAQIREGLAEWRAMGHRSGPPYLVLLLAQVLQRSGAADEALGTVEEGLALAAEISPAVRAELYRLKGELLNHRAAPVHDSHCPAPLQAEAYFGMAVAEARQRGSRLLELRATMSLARLWAEQGKGDEAHRALAAIYGWFTEGLDTPDLRAAGALLDVLSSAPAGKGT
jgi:adenylate cyclase